MNPHNIDPRSEEQLEEQKALMRKAMMEAFNSIYKKPSVGYLVLTLPIAVFLFFVTRIMMTLRFVGSVLFTWMVKQSNMAIIICLIAWIAFLNGLLNLAKYIMS